MTTDYDYVAFEKACDARRKENDGYIREFDEWLMAQGLSDKTIQRHINNVDFYLNTYLLREDAYGMEDGCFRVDDFLGYFFIRKCMWSTPATIKQNATSFKKFYKCMLKAGHIERESYDNLLDVIKNEMPLWLEDCEEYNNPSSDELDSYFGGDPLDRGLFETAYEAVARSLGLDYLLDGDDGDDSDLPDEDEGDLLTEEDAVDMLVMALYYLTSHKGKERTASTSTAQEVIDRLTERGWIDDLGTGSVAFTRDGEFVGRESLAILGFDYLVLDKEDGDSQNHGLRLVD